MTEQDIEEQFPTKYGVVPVGGPRIGPAHDRGLCALTATVAAVGASRWLIEHGASAMSVYAMGLYLGAAIAGYGVGKWVPAEHRAAVQVGCGAVLSIVGGGIVGGGL